MNNSESRYEHLPLDLRADNADLLAEMGEWKCASDSETIGVLGLGPCIGIALYDAETKRGFMVHTLGFEVETVELMLSAVAAEVSDPSKMRAWIGGGELDQEDYDDPYLRNIRDDVTQRLLSIGISKDNLTSQWNDDPDNAIDMFLDCSTGECEIIANTISALQERRYRAD